LLSEVGKAAPKKVNYLDVSSDFISSFSLRLLGFSSATDQQLIEETQIIISWSLGQTGFHNNQLGEDLVIKMRNQAPKRK
jgi:hypothetical protein